MLKICKETRVKRRKTQSTIVDAAKRIRKICIDESENERIRIGYT